MRKLLPLLAAALVAAGCAQEKAEGPSTDAVEAPSPEVGAEPAAPATPTGAAADDTATVTVDPAAATSPPPAANSTLEATGGTAPAPQP